MYTHVQFRLTPLISGLFVAWLFALLLIAPNCGSVSPYAARIACLAGIIAGFALSAVAGRSVRAAYESAFVLAGGALVVLGSAFAFGLLGVPNSAAPICVLGFAGIGGGLAFTAMGAAQRALATFKEDFGIAECIGVLLGAVLYYLASCLPPYARGWSIVFFALASVLMLQKGMGLEALGTASDSLQPSAMIDGMHEIYWQQRAADRSPHRVFKQWNVLINTTCFQLAFGMILALLYNRMGKNPASFEYLHLFVAVDAVVAGIAVLALKRKIRMGNIAWVMMFLAAMGVLLILLLFNEPAVCAGFALVVAAEVLLLCELYMHFCAICSGRALSLFVLFPIGFGALMGGELVGMVIGVLLLPFHNAALILALVFIIYALMISLTLLVVTLSEGVRASQQEADGLVEAAAAASSSLGAAELSSEENGRESQLKEKAASYKLTKKEGEILSYLLQGRSASYIADLLFVSAGTVRTHIKHIYAKTGVHGRQELIDLFQE